MAQQKTAMEQWIQWYENATNYEKDNYSHKKAKKLLVVERVQIEEAYKRGCEEAKSKAIKYVEDFTTRLQNETK